MTFELFKSLLPVGAWAAYLIIATVCMVSNNGISRGWFQALVLVACAKMLLMDATP